MKTGTKTTSPSPLQAQPPSITSVSSTSSPEQVQEDAKWGLWSTPNSPSLLLLPPHAVPPLQRGVPPMGHSPA